MSGVNKVFRGTSPPPPCDNGHELMGFESGCNEWLVLNLTELELFFLQQHQQSVCENTRQSVLISPLLEHDNRIQIQMEIIYIRKVSVHHLLVSVRENIGIFVVIIWC